MQFISQILPGACGVEVWYDFNDGWTKVSKDYIPSAGCGIICAGFIVGNKTCDAMFKKMSELGTFLYKTPERLNRNSTNMFYFALFDFSKDEKGKYGYKDVDEADE